MATITKHGLPEASNEEEIRNKERPAQMQWAINKEEEILRVEHSVSFCSYRKDNHKYMKRSFVCTCSICI